MPTPLKNQLTASVEKMKKVIEAGRKAGEEIREERKREEGKSKKEKPS